MLDAAFVALVLVFLENDDTYSVDTGYVQITVTVCARLQSLRIPQQGEARLTGVTQPSAIPLNRNSVGFDSCKEA